MNQYIRGVKRIPSVINKHFWLYFALFYKLYKLFQFSYISIMPVIKGIIKIMKIIGIQFLYLLGSLIILIGRGRSNQIQC